MKNVIIGDLMRWDMPITTREINILQCYEDKYPYVHITVIRWQKNGFWNKVFRRKEIIVYLNGEEQIRANNFTGTIHWWSKIS